ncbi:MAG: wax ester/triacylglycerol synthase family O-acyltransferase [Gammaproteobacteria bacterium]|nr:wax ester/triacylglycerol synthase family O-acyltransferase [Gammaproteobacteria bacterium]MBP6482169.1 wax ester/triacylglycerol synthase family O-acyltransferase [Pseudomonadales bacterium]MBP7912219.1 wax ester/triacylglycerol synthase family O-acyltransferase [Pseudomonadales bacterium]
MKQLGVLDSAFINLELPGTPQHIGGLGIYDPSTAPGGFVRFKSVIAGFERRLRRTPQFRARLQQVPGGIDRPYWIIDEDFDLEFHVRHIALPAPGDWRQLCIQVARLHARALDFSRPLWEAWIIEGLDNVPGLPRGSFAIYGKLHHALFDGAGGQVFVDALHDLAPVPVEEAPAGAQDRLYADEALGEVQMLGRAAMHQLVNGVDVAQGMLRAGGEIARMLLGHGEDGGKSLLASAPRTRFNEPVGPRRSFEAASFALADFRALRNASGARLNTLALTVIGGALRRYLGARAELPERALNAAIPLDLRRRRADSGDTNQVGTVYLSLHTDLADPLQRLEAVRRGADGARERGARYPLVDTMKLAGLLPPALVRAAGEFYAAHGLTRRMPLVTSTVVANAAGPEIPLYCAGARLVRYHGLGPLSPGMGIYHTVFSCNDTLTMSVLADREHMPDPAFYRECLEESFAELRDAL